MTGDLNEISQAIGQLQQSAADTKDDLAELKRMVAGHIDKTGEFQRQMNGYADHTRQHEIRLDSIEPAVKDYERQKQRILGMSVGLSVGSGSLAAWLARFFGLGS